jgi:glycosyltransferase involved in cell wall biosynthesis
VSSSVDLLEEILRENDPFLGMVSSGLQITLSSMTLQAVAVKALRVLYVIDSLAGGGAEQSLIDVISDLERCDIHLDVVTLLPDDGLLTTQLVARGAGHHSLARIGRIRQVLWLRQQVRTGAYDLVHSTLLRADVLCRLASLGSPVTLVTTLPNDSYGREHRKGSRYGSLAVRMVQLLEILTVWRVDSFHAVSSTIADTMATRLRIKRSNIEVIWRGRDAVRLGRRSIERGRSTRERLGLDPNAPTVLCVGRQDFQKGLDLAIRAHALVRQTRPTSTLLLVGRPGNATKHVRALLDSELGAGVIELGHRSDVPDLMCASDVLCFPSRWEGLGGTLIEAMALELPIVASQIPPIAETVGNRIASLVTPENVEELAAELLRALGGGMLPGTNDGRRRFETFFSSQGAARQVAALYHRATGATSLVR